MNYYTLRIAIVIITTIIVSLITVIRLKESPYKKEIIVRYLALAILLVISFPIEEFFIRFKTPTQLVKHYHPTSKIKKEYIYDDYAYIYYKGNDAQYFEFIVKKKGGWKKSNSSRVDIWNDKKYTFYIVQSNINNTIGIKVSSIDKTGTEVNISDNINSDFTKIVEDSNVEGYMITTVITVINKKKDENYVLYLDGKAYNPL